MHATTAHCRHCDARQSALAPSLQTLVEILEALGWSRLVVWSRWPRSLGGTCPACEAGEKESVAIATCAALYSAGYVRGYVDATTLHQTRGLPE